jgi:hypothetical protein
MVVDGSMARGPMGPGSILAVVFEGSSTSGKIDDPDSLAARRLLMPPFIVNQRPWTVGYAETIATTDRLPDVDYVFDDFAFGRLVDRNGAGVEATRSESVGEWGLGNEYTLANNMTNALSR